MGVLDLKDANGEPLIPAGVLTGSQTRALFEYARENKFAIPAINCTSSSTVNAVLEAARDVKSPIIIQVSQGGAAYFAGKGLANDKQQASIAGAVAAAHHVHVVAAAYGVPVVLHSDHCAKKLLEWFDGMLAADQEYYAQHKKPLFSSHMLDLSEDPKEYNISKCKEYLEKMKDIDLWLEMEIGITGGEEDGVDNSGVKREELFTQPEVVFEIFKTLRPVSPNFSIAAAFGNVHGVYKPGNVQLEPKRLEQHQEAVPKLFAQLEKSESEADRAIFKAYDGTLGDKPLFLVFHGGSGSEAKDIRRAVRYGVVKMNVDTDTQFAYLQGIRDFVLKKKDYLLTQVGNPDGADKPNKKYYDPRVWVREGEKTLSERVKIACKALRNDGRLSGDRKLTPEEEAEDASDLKEDEAERKAAL